MDEDDRRKLLSTAFEPYQSGYLYYRNRWAGGVPVSPEEMEEFISSDALRAMQLGREYAKRTAVTPPRHTNPWLVADAIPMSVAAGLVTVAFAAAALAVRPDPPLPTEFLWAVAVFMGVLAVTLFTRRLVRES